MKKMLLVDGNSMLFRAFYATFMRPMSTSTGIPTNAIYGFAMMINKAVQIIQPDAMLVAFDKGKHTFRHELFAEYKGGRKETPDALVEQFPIVREYLEAAGIKQFEMTDIEADDIIGSMIKKYPDWDINVLSSDRDMLQLIDETTSVWLMKKGISDIEEMTVESLKEKMGITPDQIRDLKGLMGDASDNIPGIPKVGEKTALKLLEQFGTVENLIANTDQLKGKLKENVEAFKDQALLSKRLATIKTDVEIPFETEEFTFHITPEPLRQFYVRYEMNSLASKLSTQISEQAEAEAPASQPTLTVAEVRRCPEALLQDNAILVLDQDQPSVYFADVHGLALAYQDQAVYITIEDVRQDEALLAYLAGEKTKIVYDVKACLHLADGAGLTINGMKIDAMIAAFLCDSTLTSDQKIREKFGLTETVTMDEVYGKPGKMKLPEPQLQRQLCAQKIQLIDALWKDSEPKLNEMEIVSLFYDVEMPLAVVLYKMEKEGIRIDSQTLDDIARQTQARLDALTDAIYAAAGETFNINSPKQLGEVLFDKLGLPASGKKRSTSADVLEKLLGVHPIIADLLEFRKYQKLYSTYAEGLKKYIHPDGRIHTIYNQCATQTGRLSSTEPNLQNISVRDEESREVRKAFLPSEGNVLVASDYSQIELRMLAHMADEQGLLDAFRHAVDIHTKTASDVFQIPLDQVDAKHRRQAKAVNFGIVYGISDFGLSQQLDISRAQAKEFIERYLQSYPNISKYMDQVISFCQEHGYTATMLGRRREVPEIHDKNYMTREFGKRAAMNAPIQGSAADLIKLAMIRIDKAISEKGLQSKMILQVHDELIFDALPSELDALCAIIQEGMEHAMELKVPLVAETKIGNTWYEAK